MTTGTMIAIGAGVLGVALIGVLVMSSNNANAATTNVVPSVGGASAAGQSDFQSAMGTLSNLFTQGAAVYTAQAEADRRRAAAGTSSTPSH